MGPIPRAFLRAKYIECADEHTALQSSHTDNLPQFTPQPPSLHNVVSISVFYLNLLPVVGGKEI